MRAAWAFALRTNAKKRYRLGAHRQNKRPAFENHFKPGFGYPQGRLKLGVVDSLRRKTLGQWVWVYPKVQKNTAPRFNRQMALTSPRGSGQRRRPGPRGGTSRSLAGSLPPAFRDLRQKRRGVWGIYGRNKRGNQRKIKKI